MVVFYHVRAKHVVRIAEFWHRMGKPQRAEREEKETVEEKAFLDLPIVAVNFRWTFGDLCTMFPNLIQGRREVDVILPTFVHATHITALRYLRMFDSLPDECSVGIPESAIDAYRAFSCVSPIVFAGFALDDDDDDPRLFAALGIPWTKENRLCTLDTHLLMRFSITVR